MYYGIEIADSIYVGASIQMTSPHYVLADIINCI